jgi:hypothetical protein
MERRAASSFGVAEWRDAPLARGAGTCLQGRLVRLDLDPRDTPEKPNPSTHNPQRLGFRDLYDRVNWVKMLRGT